MFRRHPARAARRTVTAATLCAATGLLAATFSAAPAAAGTGYAASARFPGLGGGRLWDLAVDPANASVVLAATDDGVYRSGDGGATFYPTALRGQRVWVVGWDVRGSHPAYAGLDGRGVETSTDEGNNWTDVSSGLTDMTVRSLAFGLEGMAAGTRSGVDVSADGRHWHSAGLDGYSVSAVVVSANQPQLTLVAGVDGMPAQASSSAFLFRNTGGTLQWQTLQQGLPSQTFVSSVAVGPLPSTGQPRPLLATTAKGAYHSIDGGTTWTQSTGVPDQTSLTVAGYSPLDPNLLYAGEDAGGSSGGMLMRSTDGGASFTQVADALPDGKRNVDALAVGAATPPQVLVGVNPPSGGAVVYRGADANAPAPAGTGQDSAGAGLASPAPTPKPTAHAKVVPRSAPPPAESTGFRHFLDVVVRFPFPLTLELLFVLLIVYLVLRWRQRYLDIEGPP